MTLLEYLCLEPSIPELDFVLYSRQIFAALHCLQEHQLLHLNIIVSIYLTTFECRRERALMRSGKSVTRVDVIAGHGILRVILYNGAEALFSAQVQWQKVTGVWNVM